MNCRGCSLKSDQLTKLRRDHEVLSDSLLIALEALADASTWGDGIAKDAIDWDGAGRTAKFRAKAALSAIAQRARTK